ncbi:hypothetical protein Nepgr_007625 [Nepenthes gracilis]|uniref:Kinesin motor domain-containing protein n=1 Tax=Nepenthes gracilis TaxID=150966 RepID=A0AAD3S786_NEPGR|nr:hypothetical protein Nepgr_007625 [Nepenthes gracilis]
MEPKLGMHDHSSLSALPLKNLQRLIKLPFSNMQQRTKRSKSQSISDENTPPPHPNVQLFETQFSQFNPSISPSILLHSHKDLDHARSNRCEEVLAPHDPSVKVFVRIRPFNIHERGGGQMVKKVSDNAVRVGDREFCFDSILDSNSQQEDVFRLVGVPLVKNALAGYNASVLCYGQSGSGKTYTMWGPPSAMIKGHSASSQEGIVPRIFRMLFSEIEREKQNSDGKQINYQCRCSFLEIYGGQIGDLLDPTRRNLEDAAKNALYIENLTEEYVSSYDDVTQILIKGLSSWQMCMTSMNSKRSRSHVIFTCIIESWCKDQESCLNVLESSNSNCSILSSGSADVFINKRFHVNCSHLVSSLADGTQPEDFTNRSSHLTHLLQESLGGNAKLSVICTISSVNKNCGETFSTLRFGQRVRSVKNCPVINEISEDDVNDLSGQICQLKEELVKAKIEVHQAETIRSQLKWRSVRGSVNQLRISLNRSLMLTSIDKESEEEIDANEDDVTELCKQHDNLHRSNEEGSSGELSFEGSSNFASAQGSCDTYFTSEDEKNCLHECDEINSAVTLDITDPSFRRSISPCSWSGVLEDPPLSESPKFRNIQRKNTVNTSALLENLRKISELSKLNLDLPGKLDRQSELKRSSLQSSKISSGPAESLADSLKRGLIIDYHWQNSLSNNSSVAFSFEHLMLKSSSAVDKANASVQTLSEGRLSSLDGTASSLCISCRQRVNHGSNDIQDSLKTCIMDLSSDRSTREITRVFVQQFTHERECCHFSKQSQKVENKEPEVIKETCEIKELHQDHGNASFDMKEKEELLKEIQTLKIKFKAYTEETPNKSIEKMRSSLLSQSMQLQSGLCSRDIRVEEKEKERQRWIEMESKWINLTDELRIDLESNHQRAEKVEMALMLEQKCTKELDGALHRALLSHARIIEHYVELQEKYNDLSDKHRRIMEGVAEAKKMSAKAGAKGQGSHFAKALAAELSALRVEKEREREWLKKENRSLHLQLRNTAEAVRTAGELLVKLREAEEAAFVAEANFTNVQHENDWLRKLTEKLKRKHKMEMVAMKQYMAESKLPEAALRTMQFEGTEVMPTGMSTEPGKAHRHVHRAR